MPFSMTPKAPPTPTKMRRAKLTASFPCRGLSVIAIDLERMKCADRVFDLGRIAGELQHYFLQATGNKHSAEPFIGHFLWEYACHFPAWSKSSRSKEPASSPSAPRAPSSITTCLSCKAYGKRKTPTT